MPLVEKLQSSLAGDAKDMVKTTMSELRSKASDFEREFRSNIAALLTTVGQPPEFPALPETTLDMPVLAVDEADYALPDLPPIDLDVSAASIVRPPTALNTPAAPNLAARDEPAMLPISAVPLPDMVLASAPVRGTIDTAVTLPATPDFTMPTMDALSAITVPSFTPPTLPTFSDTAPTFNAIAPSGTPVWTEPTYLPEVMDEVLPTVRRMMQGDLGLPPAVQELMFERARSREDRTALKAVNEAFDTFANRGFTMPPGMLAQQVNAALEQNQLQANALQREVLIKVADVAVENMRAAVQQGLAAEQILVNIHQNAAQRAYDMARYTVEAALSLYNAQANIFNATTQAYSVRAQVFKTELDAELSKLEVQRFALEQAKVTGEINQQRVATFTARVQALSVQAEAYRTQVQAQTTKVDIAKAQIEAYRADVEAYATLIGSNKAMYDAYASRANVEQAKAQTNVANAQVFRALLDQDQMKIDIWKTQADAEVKRIQLEHDSYASQVTAFREEVAAKVAKMQYEAEQNRISLTAYTEKHRARSAVQESLIRVAEAKRQTSLSQVEVNMKAYEVTTNHILAQRDIQAHSLQAAGQMAATLAGGAMAAQNVQASMSYSEGRSTSLSNTLADATSKNYSFEALNAGQMPV